MDIDPDAPRVGLAAYIFQGASTGQNHAISYAYCTRSFAGKVASYLDTTRVQKPEPKEFTAFLVVDNKSASVGTLHVGVLRRNKVEFVSSQADCEIARCVEHIGINQCPVFPTIHHQGIALSNTKYRMLRCRPFGIVLTAIGRNPSATVAERDNQRTISDLKIASPTPRLFRTRGLRRRFAGCYQPAMDIGFGRWNWADLSVEEWNQHSQYNRTSPSYSLHSRDSLAGMVQTPGIT
jgi:hypothetical protein